MANSTITGLTLVSGVSTGDRFVLDRGVGTFGIAGDVLVSSIANQISGEITSAVSSAITSVNVVVSGLESRISTVSALAAAAGNTSAVSSAITSVNAVVSNLESRISTVSVLAASGGDTSAVSSAITSVNAVISVLQTSVASLENRISAVSALTGGGGSGPWYLSNAPSSTTFTSTLEFGTVSVIYEEDDSDTGFLVAARFDNSTFARLYIVSASPPFTVTARVNHGGTIGEQSATGIFVRNSGSDQRLIYSRPTDNFNEGFQYRQYTGLVQDTFAQATPNYIGDGATWLRIAVSTNGNVSYQVSPEGKKFFQILSQSNPIGTSVNQCGIALAANGTGATRCYGAFSFFEVT